MLFTLLFSTLALAAPIELESGNLGSGRMFTSCAFDGEMRRCQFDSGSASSHAEKEGLLGNYPILAPATQYGASGIAMACDWVIVHTFTAAGISSPEAPIVRCEGSAPGNVLGIDFFQGKTLRFDAKARALTASYTSIPAPRESFTFSPAGLVLLPVSLSGLPGNAVWDTGAGLTSVDIAFAQSNPELFTFVRDITDGFDSTGHAVKMELFTLKEITVGSHTWQNLPVLGLDLSSARAGGIGQGTNLILGFNLIIQASWAIDLRSRSWTISP